MGHIFSMIWRSSAKPHQNESTEKRFSDVINNIGVTDRVYIIADKRDNKSQTPIAQKIDQATSAEEIALYNGFKDITSCKRMMELFNATLDELKNADGMTNFKLSDTTGLDSPVIGQNGTTIYTINININQIHKDVYIYASTLPDDCILFALTHPVALVIIHEMGHLYDALVNQKKLLKGINRYNPGDYKEKLKDNFKTYNKENFDKKFQQFMHYTVEQVFGHVKNMFPNLTFNIAKRHDLDPKLLCNYFYDEFSEQLVKGLIQDYTLSQEQQEILQGAIQNMFWNRKISRFRKTLKKLFIKENMPETVKRKAGVIEKIAYIVNAYYNIYESWSKENYDDLLNIMPKVINVQTYSEAIFLKEYIDRFPEKVHIFPLESVTFNNVNEAELPKDESICLKAAEVFAEGRIVERFGHEPIRSSMIKFGILSNNLADTKEKEIPLLTAEQRISKELANSIGKCNLTITISQDDTTCLQVEFGKDEHPLSNDAGKDSQPANADNPNPSGNANAMRKDGPFECTLKAYVHKFNEMLNNTNPIDTNGYTTI